MAVWCSIFCATESRDTIIAHSRDWITANGYTFYDPFDIIPGASYPLTVKLFVSPVMHGRDGAWMRLILSERIEGLAESLISLAPVHLLDLADFTGATASDSPSISGVDLTSLPQDAQSMAQNIDMKHAGAMANKILGSLGKRLGASDADAAAARALLANAETDWSTGTGARLAAQAALLGLPANWHTPDFTTLRDAYAVHKRLERSPNARLYGGDAEARDAVPDALTYTPLFGGKRP